jgi:hypothetical protein
MIGAVKVKIRMYHGGPPFLSKNSKILPPSVTGVKCASDFGAGHVHRRDKVYVTSDLLAAKMFASLHPSGLGEVFEVEPFDDIEPDPDCDDASLSFQCSYATVIRKINFPKHERRDIRASFIGGLLA